MFRLEESGAKIMSTLISCICVVLHEKERDKTVDKSLSGARICPEPNEASTQLFRKCCDFFIRLIECFITSVLLSRNVRRGDPKGYYTNVLLFPKRFSYFYTTHAFVTFR